MGTRRILSDIALRAIDEVTFEELEKASSSIGVLTSIEEMVQRAIDKAAMGGAEELPVSTAVSSIV